jgi:hypothetical protein
MRDAGRWDKGEHAVEKSDTRAQDRRKGQLLAGDHRCLHRLQGRLDVDHLEGQVAGDFVAKQHPDLVQELPKAFGRTVALAHQRELVLHQRMTDDVYGIRRNHVVSSQLGRP